MNKLSVIIATYKRSALLDAGLGSIARQSGIPMEIVVVNDGILDETEEVCKKHAAKLPITYIFSGHRNLSNASSGRGPGVALNIGVKQCTGSFIVLSCPEMYHISACLHSIWHSAPKRDELITPEKILFDDVGSVTASIVASSGARVNATDKTFSTIKNAEEMPFLLGMWKEKFMEIGGYDEDYQHGWACEDSDLMRRLVSGGMKYRKLPMDVLHLYHGKRCDGNVHPENPLWVRNWELFKARDGIRIRNQGRPWGSL